MGDDSPPLPLPLVGSHTTPLQPVPSPLFTSQVPSLSTGSGASPIRPSFLKLSSIALTSESRAAHQ